MNIWFKAQSVLFVKIYSIILMNSWMFLIWLTIRVYHFKFIPVHRSTVALQGLSHEIDFKNFDKKFTELVLTKGGGWFLNFFRGSNDFIMQKVYFLRLMPVCVGLIMVSCLFLSVLPNNKWSKIEQGWMLSCLPSIILLFWILAAHKTARH